MKHVFYALIILQALYEFSKLFRCKSLYRHVKVFQKLDKTSKRWDLMAHPWLHVALFMDTLGLLLLGIGLFSSQWVCFLIVLAMSFSRIQKIGSMGDIPGQSGYGYCVRFRHPERIPLGIKQKGSQPTRLEANSHTRL